MSTDRLVFKKVRLGTVAVTFCAGIAAWSVTSAASAEDKIPQFESPAFGWLGGGEWRNPAAGLRGPIRNDPAHPYRGNNDGLGQPTVRMGNWNDPILKPWAAAQMKASNEEVNSGKVQSPFTAQSRCYPGGVPGQLLYPAEPMYFIQRPKVVYMIWQRDHMVRRVFLTDRHSETVKPSWFGESIGRYENDGSLFVDTVGLSTENSYVDNFRTPHTTKLHVQERFKVAADGKTLEAAVKVEDPDTFNEPMHMTQRWRQVPNLFQETVCSENNQDHFGQGLFPIPEAKKADF